MSDLPALYTCSYYEHRQRMGVGVRTSLGTPRWIKRETPWPYAPEVTPRGWYLNAPDKDFAAAFTRQLHSHGVEGICDRFRRIAEETGADALVLLCFEKLDTSKWWCHRTLFAQWWQEQTGQEIPELGAQPLTLFDQE